MPRKSAIPKEIKEQVQEMVTQFNEANKTNFKIVFRGKFGYLSKLPGLPPSLTKDANHPMATVMRALLGKPKETKLGRLTWTGDIAKWDFAVFRYSREFYDPDEWMFPGSGKLDGTIEGALKAGIELYP